MSSCLDKDSYDKIWDVLIFPQIQKHFKRFENYLYIPATIKDDIWEQYVVLNKKIKSSYMQDPSKLLDRHKVAACYMCAICMAKPIRVKDGAISNKEAIYVANELVAIATGMDIVANYAEAAAVEDTKLTGDEKEKIIECLKDGLVYPNKNSNKNEVNHGEYILNYAMELYFAKQEEKLNLLSIAHELYLLEVLTLRSEKVY